MHLAYSRYRSTASRKFVSGLSAVLPIVEASMCRYTSVHVHGELHYHTRVFCDSKTAHGFTLLCIKEVR